MNRSPLHELNESLGARFTDFGGWDMPVQYESVLAEHKAVRLGVGVFDVTHLGRFELSGSGARPALRKLLCNDIERVEPGKCQYTMMLNSSGGVIDDIIVWWLDDDRFWVMPNAANQERVMASFSDEPDCVATDLQMSTVFLALQGPKAKDLFEGVVGPAPGRFANSTLPFGEDTLTVAGTGYTGESGVEICVSPEGAEALMSALIDAGATPCGLGARDTLRLEAGFSLWGQDIDESTTPIEAGLGFAVSMDHEYTGREVLAHQKEHGVERRLTGFILSERGVPREGHLVRSTDGATGHVTSGNHSPILNRGIGLAYISPPVPAGTPIEVKIRDRWLHAVTARPPLHLA